MEINKEPTRAKKFTSQLLLRAISIFLLVLVMLLSAYILWDRKNSKSVDKKDTSTQKEVFCVTETKPGQISEYECLQSHFAKLDTLNVVGLESPTRKYSVNIWYAPYEQDEEGNPIYLTYGNIIDKPYGVNIYNAYLYDFERSDKARPLFADLVVENDSGWGSIVPDVGLIRWRDDASFILRKTDGLRVVDVEKKETTIIKSPVVGYDLIDIDKNLKVGLMKKQEYTKDNMYAIYDFNKNELISIDADAATRIVKYDYFTDRFVFYPANINTAHASASGFDTLILYNPLDMSEKKYNIALDLSIDVVGRECGGWHLISDTKGILKINDMCEGAFDTRSPYLKNGIIEIDLR